MALRLLLLLALALPALAWSNDLEARVTALEAALAAVRAALRSDAPGTARISAAGGLALDAPKCRAKLAALKGLCDNEGKCTACHIPPQNCVQSSPFTYSEYTATVKELWRAGGDCARDPSS
jgi:hypothetical protein